MTKHVQPQDERGCPAAPSDVPRGLLDADLEALWEQRSRRLDALLTEHGPLAQPSAALLRRRERRVAGRSYFLAACFLLALLVPSYLGAQVRPLKHPSNRSYSLDATIAGFESTLKAL